MSELSPSLSLPLMQPAQAQKHVTHNEALMRLDMLVQLTVLSRTEDTPSAPVEGTLYIVPDAAGGAWAGQDDRIARYLDGAWSFFDPSEGWRAHVVDEAVLVSFVGGTWVAAASGGGGVVEQLPRLGLNTAADDTNRLSVSADATLLSNAGGGHQLKLNKAAPADTASLLFQTGFGGRAEMGIAGNDAFAIKVSPDGADWTTALEFDPASGTASGMAIQQSAEDTTPGRLMRADYGYGPGTLLGTVGQVGGAPTGAVIERGSGPGGDFVRFADGTQIVQHQVVLTRVAAAIATETWTYPAAFAAGTIPHISGLVDVSSLAATAPTMAPQELTGLIVDAADATGVLLQVRALPSFSFAPDETVVIRPMAVGRWF